MVLVGHGCKRRHLGDQADRSDHALMRIGDIGRVVVEGGHGAQATHHDSHRVGITTEAGEELRHLLVQHGVAGYTIVEIGLLGCGRQFAVKKQIAGFEEVAMLGKLVDRVAAIKQDAFVTIDIGDFGFARSGGSEARVVGECVGILVKWTNINDIRPDSAFSHRQIERFAVEGKAGCLI
ncbi:Uncharacterised protein [Brucella melitensis]|nr:Uncharacterised protein [Brucella melitensis]